MGRFEMDPYEKATVFVVVIFALFLLLLSLVGCATPAPAIVHACPSVPVYSKQFQKLAGGQLATLPTDSPIAVMVRDYIAVRKEVKDCH